MGETMTSESTRDRLLDAAERRVRIAGYNGFSFRDLAANIGIKSASVHHHFPTKEDLVTTLAARYRERFLSDLAKTPPGPHRIGALRDRFRAAIAQDGGMCLCGMLGAESRGLPERVIQETTAYFRALEAYLTEGGGPAGAPNADGALAIIATLEGALILSRSLDDLTVFDRATAQL
ncbi:MAG: TetR/AcrR family transcriptional regulator [Pseudomonadota bacterium]